MAKFLECGLRVTDEIDLFEEKPFKKCLDEVLNDYLCGKKTNSLEEREESLINFMIFNKSIDSNEFLKAKTLIFENILNIYSDKNARDLVDLLEENKETTPSSSNKGKSSQKKLKNSNKKKDKAAGNSASTSTSTSSTVENYNKSNKMSKNKPNNKAKEVKEEKAEKEVNVEDKEIQEENSDTSHSSCDVNKSKTINFQDLYTEIKDTKSGIDMFMLELLNNTDNSESNSKKANKYNSGIYVLYI